MVHPWTMAPLTSSACCPMVVVTVVSSATASGEPRIPLAAAAAEPANRMPAILPIFRLLPFPEVGLTESAR